MAIQKHTPMKWAYDEDDARIYYDDGIVRPTIAYVERDGVAPEQVKADGFLLAASPSLLNACKAAENWLAEYETGPDTGLHGLLAQIREAVTRAAGAAS